MTLGASCWAGRFVGLLGLVMTTLAVLMGGIFHRKSLSFCLGLMAVFAQFPAGFALLPGMVALHAIDFVRLGVFLMGEGHFPIGNIEGNRIFLSESPCDHQDGEQKTCKDSDADQSFLHYCFTPFLLDLIVPQLLRPKKSNKNSFFVKKKKRFLKKFRNL
jgi:hypothetical protein